METVLASADAVADASAVLQTKQRSHIYRLISVALERLPDEALVHAFQAAEVAAQFRDLGHDLGLPTVEEDAVMDLRVEFTRLFVGPGPRVPCYGSLYQVQRGEGEGRLWADCTVEVSRFMGSLDMESKYDGRVLDHVGVEMDFMHRLVRWQVDLLERGDTAAVDQSALVQKRFLEDHVLPWVPRFCERVIGQARLPFYRGIAGVTQQFLSHEAALLGIETQPKF